MSTTTPFEKWWTWWFQQPPRLGYFTREYPNYEDAFNAGRAALLAELAGKMPRPLDHDPNLPMGRAAYNRALADVRAALGLPEGK